MKFIKAEQQKIDPVKKKVEFSQKKKTNPELPDDSCSEITDVEKDGILTKYYKAKMSKSEKRKEAR